MFGFCFVFSTFCPFVHSSFAIILLEKRDMVALLLLCSECHVTVFLL